MNAEFQWWLLILGIVIGGALVYLVLADLQGDRDADEADAVVEAEDRPLADDLGPDLDEPGPDLDELDATLRDGAKRETPVADVL
ncbi:MAG: hypothetical protein M3P84_06525 [Chloroflexota bacterium]|nr:hypothetical protein [Chloroflexota bacterium]